MRLCIYMTMACVLACGDNGGSRSGSESESESEAEGEGGSESESESEAESEVELVCPGAKPALEDCFRGIAFADCGGDGDPVLACVGESCSDELGCTCGFCGCLWFTGGCGPEVFETGLCVPGEPCDFSGGTSLACPLFLYERGAEPWDAERAMTLEVTVDSGFSASATAISCTGCSDDNYNCDGDNVCVADAADQVTTGYLRDTLAIDMFVYGYYGWTAEIEVKLDVLTARLCRIFGTDAWFGDCPVVEPVCATSGTLTLSSAPASTDDVAGLSGAITATFDDGLEITGEFLVP